MLPEDFKKTDILRHLKIGRAGMLY
jgi:hypothetical protein